MMLEYGWKLISTDQSFKENLDVCDSVLTNCHVRIVHKKLMITRKQRSITSKPTYIYAHTINSVHIHISTNSTWSQQVNTKVKQTVNL